MKDPRLAMGAYTERQHLPYPATQLFDLVADVERYPEFVPGVIAVNVRGRSGNEILVEMTMAVGPFRRRFSSTGELHRPHRIDIRSSDPLFDRFAQHWTFSPSVTGGTDVEYCADFKLRSPVLQVVAGGSIATRATATLSAFGRRASDLYGSLA